MWQAEYILDRQKQLSLMSGEARRDSNGALSSEESTIPSMSPADKVCDRTQQIYTHVHSKTQLKVILHWING